MEQGGTASRTSAATSSNKCGSRGPELRALPAKGCAKCRIWNRTARRRGNAADEVHNSGERVELLGLASVYMALADYVDRGHEHGTANRNDQDEEMRKHS